MACLEIEKFKPGTFYSLPATAHFVGFPHQSDFFSERKNFFETPSTRTRTLLSFFDINNRIPTFMVFYLNKLLPRNAIRFVLGLDIWNFCHNTLKLFSVAPHRPCLEIRSGFFRKLDVWPRGHFLKCRENIGVSPASPSTGWLYEFSPEFPFSFGAHSEVAPRQIFSRIPYSSKFTSLGLKIVTMP